MCELLYFFHLLPTLRTLSLLSALSSIIHVRAACYANEKRDNHMHVCVCRSLHVCVYVCVTDKRSGCQGRLRIRVDGQTGIHFN